MKTNNRRILAVALAVVSAASLCPVGALASSGVRVESPKSGVQTAQAAKDQDKTPFPYAQRIKVNDLIHYTLSDFLQVKPGKQGQEVVYANEGMDAKAKTALKPLAGSNWYSSESISYLLKRCTEPYALNVQLHQEDGKLVEEATGEMQIVDDVVYEDAPAPGDRGTARSKHSSTNVQVQDVDEADIIKTDGKYIYYLSSNGIAIVEANAGQPKQVAKLKPNARIGESLPDYRDLYINGTTLVIIAQKNGANIFAGLQNEQGALPNSLYRRNDSAFVSIDLYDISNPKRPKLKRQVNIEGELNTTRLSGQSLYFVINRTMHGSENVVEVLPKYQDSLLGEEYYVMAPKDIYLDAYRNTSTFFTMITGALSLQQEQPIAPQAYETEGVPILYMNQDDMYLAAPEYIYPKNSLPKLVERGLRPAYPVQADQSLRFQRLNSTLLSRFALGKHTVGFASMTRFWGTVASQRSMDVQGQNLRIVSTGQVKDDWQNTVLVLDAKALKKKGQSNYFSKGVAVSSVRFMGDVAYITDTASMRVFDLKAAKPVEVGTADAFGTGYLHPYGKDYLIGIGIHEENTYVRTPENREKQFGYRDGGVEFTLFDISKPTQPKVIDQLVVGSAGSATLATADPKTLMFDSPKGVMTLPFEYRDLEIVDGQERHETWNGGVAVEFNAKQIKLGATFSLEGYYTSANSRFVYIDNVLYYVTAPYIVAMDYDTYEMISSIALQY